MHMTMYPLIVLTLLQVLLVAQCHFWPRKNCSLEDPEVFIHYYPNLTAINVNGEREKFPSSISSCARSISDLPNCCGCPADNSTLLCSSFADAESVLKARSPKSIFIGLMTNATKIDEVVEFDFSGNVAVTSVEDKGDWHGIYCTVTDNTNSKAGGLLVFRGLNHLYIGGIGMNGCGERSQWQKGFVGAVQLQNCLTTVFEDVSFIQSIGSAIVYNNSNNLAVQSSMTILNCTFCNNSLSNRTVLYGGGVSILTTNQYLSLVVTISDSQFCNNRATYGGGIALIANGANSGVSSAIALQVTNTAFTDNVAIRDGGVYYQLCLVNLVFTDCIFYNNSALHFGGVAAILGQGIILGNTYSISQDFNSCIFTNNSAFSYAILYFSLPALVENEKLEMNSVTANRNRLSPEVYDTDNCMVYLTNVNVYITNSTGFMNNYGSAICLDNAYLHLDGNVTFYQNFGYHGGAINMKGDSLLYLYNNASILFSENNAVYGGAIYRGSGGTSTSAACIFDFQEAGDDYAIMFTNNRARLSGLMIFVVDLSSTENDNCTYQLNNNIDNVVFSPSSNLNVETSTVKISFLDPIHNENGVYFFDISLGIFLTFNLNISSQDTFDSFALFYITLLENGEEYFGNSSHLQLHGPAAISLSSGEIATNLYFTGVKIEDKDDNKNFSLAFHLAEDHTISEVINLNLIPCILGFEYNPKEQKCVCVESSHLLCDERKNLACIERGFWYGGHGVVIPCSSGFCKNSFDTCTTCELEGGGQEYCLLQNSESEECTGNHVDLACEYCQEGFTFSYGARKCIQNKHCGSEKDNSVIMICSIVYLVLIMAMIYALLKLDNQTDFGYLYGIIYYYSVIGFVIPASLVDSKVTTADVLIQSFVSLSPLFLGELQICFDHSRLVLLALNYIFPIAISLICGFFILLSHIFPRHFKFKDNVGVRVTCVVILLSFTAILDTSFNIINPVQYSQYSQGDQTYVAFDPKLEYLDSKHPGYIVLWIVGMSFMIIFILPFTFFMLFSPLLMRYCNMIKIKPFLDQFHGCYKDKYRWMAGFYFLSRLVYFAIIIDPDSTVVSSYPYIRYASVTVLVIHCLLQPYKSKLLNISDTIILSDIASLSLIHNVSDIAFFGLPMRVIQDPLRVVVTYILLYVPGTCVIVLIIIHSIKKRSKLTHATIIAKHKLEHCFHVCLGKIWRRSDHSILEDSDSVENSFELDFSFKGGATSVSHRESILSHLVRSDETASDKTKSPRVSKTPLSVPTKPLRTTKTKPKFSELIGSGVMSPSDRQGSFCVEYFNYKQEDSEMMTDVTDIN